MTHNWTLKAAIIVVLCLSITVAVCNGGISLINYDKIENMLTKIINKALKKIIVPGVSINAVYTTKSQ
jgi:hypothetical protein